MNYISPVRQESRYSQDIVSIKYIADMMDTKQWVIKASHELANAYKDNGLLETKHSITESERMGLLKELGNSRYTMPGVREYILACKKRYVFTLAMGSIRIDVLYPHDRLPSKLRGQVSRSLYRARATADCFGGLGTIHVVLVPINQPRRKPQHKDMVEPKHVNGGYTYISGNTVYIYRLEEWPKVMLHELLHHVPAIQKIRWTSKMLHQLYIEFGIDKQGCPDSCSTVLEPTEAIVEAWAIFLHTVYMSHETGKSFDSLIGDEITWNKRHIAWILKKKEIAHGVWSEGTHLFSYIVLRGMLLLHLDRFLGMPMPYRAGILRDFWIYQWNMLPTMITQGAAMNGTLRMSYHGDF
jgi:hypothetical protein